MSNSSSRMNAVARIAFDKHLSDARKHVVCAMKAQASFWEALQSPSPQISSMHAILNTMHTSTEAAEHAFKGLLAINNSSLIVLRMASQSECRIVCVVFCRRIEYAFCVSSSHPNRLFYCVPHAVL